MINKIQIRELLAWTAVLLSLILLTATFAFAQQKTVNVTNEDGNVHILVKKSENGKEVIRDTSFKAGDHTDVDHIIEEFAGVDDKDSNKQIKIVEKGDKKYVKEKQNKVMIDLDIPEMSEADLERIHENIQHSMDDMQKGLKEMHKSLESMKIHVDDDIDMMDFNFEFGPGNDFHKELLMENDLDSLRDKDHIIILGDELEKPPVLEKVISKNGKQVFIYKRVNPSHEKTSSQWIEGLKVFPNPSSGKITVSFKAQKSYNLSLNVTDEKGKSVYSEKLKDFSEDYSKEINLSDKGKGSYLITISDEDNSLTKKIVVN